MGFNFNAGFIIAKDEFEPKIVQVSSNLNFDIQFNHAGNSRLLPTPLFLTHFFGKNKQVQLNQLSEGNSPFMTLQCPKKHLEIFFEIPGTEQRLDDGTIVYGSVFIKRVK